MVTTPDGSGTMVQGHVAVYAREARWRRAVAKSLEQAGHTHGVAASPPETRRMLISERFDVLTLRVRDEPDAREIEKALEDVTLPLHSIVLGSASALLLTLRLRPGGTLRYVPGLLSAEDLSRLVDASISAGTWEEGIIENQVSAHVEEVDLEEAIEDAASAVYGQAARRRQRFTTVVEGPAPYALAEPTTLRRSLIALLRLVMILAPHGSLVSVSARAGSDEWAIEIRAFAPEGRARGHRQIADALREEHRTLLAAARGIRQQGGMLWAELRGPAAPAAHFTLPRHGEVVGRSAPPDAGMRGINTGDSLATEGDQYALDR